MKVIIVGGVAGGASCAARLRRLREDAEILLLDKGEYISYANCGLPYYIGGVIQDKSRLTVQTAAGFSKRFSLTVRTRHEAVGLDAAAKTLRVKNLQTGEETTESYDTLLLAPGAAPMRPPLPGVDDGRVFTLRTIPDTYAIHEFIQREKPRRAVVVGGGFIGLEMVENLAAQGLQVDVVEMAPHLVPTLDADMAVIVKQYLCHKGVGVHTGEGVKAIVPQSGGLQVQTDKRTLAADMVLLAAGVKPDTAFLQGSGLALTPRGAIVVDEHLRTSDENIYAVGDAIEITNFVSGHKGQIPLAGPANKQGRIAADNIAGAAVKYKGTQGSAVMKLFDLTVASTGLSEAAARQACIGFEKVYTLSPSHATYYPGARNMNFKLLFEKGSGRVLGAQIVGLEGADKRCDVVATAIRAGMTVEDLTELELCYAPPYSSAKDPVNMVGYAAQNVLEGKVKQYYWEDLASLPQDGSITLLDVRNPDEFAHGHISWAVSIPLDELRPRLDELDKAKPVYVTCQSGQRSYIACRILEQYGFTAYNFAGGFGLYQLLQGEKAEEGGRC